MRTIRIMSAVLTGGSALAGVLLAQPVARDHLLLAVSRNDSSVAIFRVDGKTLVHAATIPIGSGAAARPTGAPQGVGGREVCVSADGRRAYVDSDKEPTMTVVDLAALKAIGTIPLTGLQRPDGCSTSPDSKKLYVAALQSDAVAVISLDAGKVVKAIKVGKEPRRVLFSPDARRIYVSSEGSDEITVVDAATDAVVDTIKSGGHGPRTMVFLPDRKTMLTTNVDDDTVSFINPNTKDVSLTLGAGGSPQRIEISHDGAWAFVLSVLESKISMIDLKGDHKRAKKFIPIAPQPWGMAMSDDGTLLFVTSSKDNSVTAYDTSSWDVVTKVVVNAPYGLAYR